MTGIWVIIRGPRDLARRPRPPGREMGRVIPTCLSLPAPAALPGRRPSLLHDAGPPQLRRRRRPPPPASCPRRRAFRAGRARRPPKNTNKTYGPKQREWRVSSPSVGDVRPPDVRGGCCAEAECHFCYLEDSGLYVHESCCPGNQRHLPTYVGCRRFWYSPLTKYGS